MRNRQLTIVLAVLTLIVLAASVPSSLKEVYDCGGFYIFTHAFLDDIPKRLAGPGRFRFILQPLIATILGVRAGLSDARSGNPPYLYGLLFHRSRRRELLKSAATSLANILLLGILLDSIFQWVILGRSYPGAALVVGPVLIAAPYAITRSLTNRLTRGIRSKYPM